MSVSVCKRLRSGVEGVASAARRPAERHHRRASAPLLDRAHGARRPLEGLLERARVHQPLRAGVRALAPSAGAAVQAYPARPRPTDDRVPFAGPAAAADAGRSMQCAVPVHVRNGIVDRAGGDPEGGVDAVLAQAVAEADRGPLQGHAPGHHTDRQHAPAVLQVSGSRPEVYTFGFRDFC